MTARSRVSAAISAPSSGSEPLRPGGREGFELLASVAVHFEVSTEGVTHFVATATDILAEDEHASLAAQLVDARAMVPRHRQNQVGLFDELPGEQPRAVTGEVEPPLEPYEVRAFGSGRATPATRSA